MSNKKLVYPAHIRVDANTKEEKVQTVAEHCRNTAEIAKGLAGKRLENTAYLSGLLHDFGKYTKAFKIYIEKVTHDEPAAKGSVNHTFAGVHFVMERWHKDQEPTWRNMTAELIAIAIGAHHGLFDCFNEVGKDGFLHRTTNENELYLEAKECFLADCATIKELDEIFSKATTEIETLALNIAEICKDQTEIDFRLGLLARLIISFVIEGDRRDTAEFMTGKQLYNTKIYSSEMWKSELEFAEGKILSMPVDSEINKARRSISDLCVEAAKLESGIYSLSVPTGSGKTLSSLRYSLAVAAEQTKKRVIFVIPLLSVLEQNADTIRKHVSNNIEILEHHSNIVDSVEKDETLERWQLLTETWESPLIVTTLVQFLNTLFSGKTASIRRMNALADSIIVIDEVQSVPTKMLALFTEAMNLLATAAGTTILLCSATQPGWEHMEHPIKFSNPKDIVLYDEELWSLFKRTEIKEVKDILDYDGVVSFGLDCMTNCDSLLVICNTKKEALTIFKKTELNKDAKVFHLSTGMCMAHRKETLGNVRACLKNKERVICVSTQLVEAGVDFSFSCVIRIAAGMDNIIQAAGRCNRNGESSTPQPVYIVKLKDEKLGNLLEISKAQKATNFLLDAFAQDSESFSNDLSSEESISKYYENLHKDEKKGTHNYPVSDGNYIFHMLSSNGPLFNKCVTPKDSYSMRQAFKTAGKEFKVFEDNTTDIIVPYGKGAEIIADLNSERGKYDIKYTKEKLKEAKQYSISLYDNNIKTLQKEGGLANLLNGEILALKSGFYSESLGFNIEGDDINFMEVQNGSQKHSGI